MEPQIIDYYNEIPNGINVIDKMNEELSELQKKYSDLEKKIIPDNDIERYFRVASSSHYDMAVLFHKLYKSKFKCTSIKKNEWYFLDNDEKKWKLSDGIIEIRLKLTNELLKFFEYRVSNPEKFNNNVDEYLKERYQESYLKGFLNLKNMTYKNTIIKECKDLFYDKEFLKI